MEQETSVIDLLKMLKNHFTKIILWSFIGILVSGVYTFFFVTPQFESTTKIVVNQTQNTGQAITNTDIQTNLNLINTYQSIIKEPIVLEDALEIANSKLSIGDLRNKITIQTQTSSLVFGVTVADENPYQASELANAVAKSFEAKIGDILDVQSVTILSSATPNLSPVSPNIYINILLGLVLGLMAACLQIFLMETLNKTVKDEKFIDLLGWSNLGSIIEMSNDEIKSTRLKGTMLSQRTPSRVGKNRV